MILIAEVVLGFLLIGGIYILIEHMKGQRAKGGAETLQRIAQLERHVEFLEQRLAQRMPVIEAKQAQFAQLLPTEPLTADDVEGIRRIWNINGADDLYRLGGPDSPWPES